MDKPVFEALTVASLPGRLANIAALAERLGAADSWKVREVGDGNLNLVFIVEGEKGAVVVKQALPYVRLVGDSWPLPLKRSFFEYHALTRQNERDPGMVPAIHHFDEAQALIVMDDTNKPSIARVWSLCARSGLIESAHDFPDLASSEEHGNAIGLLPAVPASRLMSLRARAWMRSHWRQARLRLRV